MKRVRSNPALRKPVSVRVTVVARILMRTSSSLGTGRSTSSMRSTSGGPYRSWTTAFMPSLPLLDVTDGWVRRGSRLVLPETVPQVCRRPGLVELGVRSGSPNRPPR